MQNWSLQWKIIAGICAFCIIASFGVMLSMYKDVAELVTLLRQQRQSQQVEVAP